jgi:hypothetical protein
MELTSKPKQKPDYRLEQMDNELLLYHPSETKILYLNQPASLIWQLCNGEHTTQELIELLGAAYPEAAGEIAADVQATLQQFLDNACIELV